MPGTSSHSTSSAIARSEETSAAATSSTEGAPHMSRWKPVRHPKGEQSMTPSIRSRSKDASRCSIVWRPPVGMAFPLGWTSRTSKLEIRSPAGPVWTPMRRTYGALTAVWSSVKLSTSAISQSLSV